MSSLRRRGRTWTLQIEFPRADGRRRRSFVKLGAISKREAEAKAAKILAQVAAGEYTDPSKETVAQFATRWLTDWAESNVSPKTSERYAELLRTACTELGDIPLQRLGGADLQRLYSRLTHLAPRTRLHIHRALSRMLKHAVQWGVLPRNPATMVDAPRVPHSEIDILPIAEIPRILDALRGRPLFAIVAVALGTGLRRGELLALRWSDLDFYLGRLRVEQAAEWTQAYGLRFKAPKTKYGRRSVSLAPSTVEVLRTHRREQLEQRLALGMGKPADDALVFATWKGEARIPESVSKEWAATMKALGITATFHALRHTHASQLIAAGIDILTIARRLGHGDATVTLRVYGHLIRSDDRSAEVIEAVLGEKG